MVRENSGDLAQARSRVALYGRVSNQRQASIPQQLELCREFAERRGWHVVYVLKEPGIPGTTDERQMYQRLLELAAEGKIDHVVVWKLDRLVRSLRHLMNLAHEFGEYGVGIASYTENFDMDSAFGRFSFRNIASFAELESELISERATLGKLGQARRGRWPTQTPPFGYRLGRARTLVKVPNEVRVVQELFRRRAKGVAITELSRWLGARGIMTHTGRSFSPQSVSVLLRNDVYRGVLRILNIEHARPDLRVIRDDTWARVQGLKRVKVPEKEVERRRMAAIDAVFTAYLDGLRDDLDPD